MNTNLVSPEVIHLLAQNCIGHESKLIPTGFLCSGSYSEIKCASLGSCLEALGRINFQAYSSCWQIPFLVIIGLRSPLPCCCKPRVAFSSWKPHTWPLDLQSRQCHVGLFTLLIHFDFLYCQMENSSFLCS